MDAGERGAAADVRQVREVRQKCRLWDTCNTGIGGYLSGSGKA